MSQPQPYYAVIFTSIRTQEDDAGYAAMADRMAELAAQMPGYLGIESARSDDGLGITVSYWESLAAIENWRDEAEHRVAQSLGKSRWYERFSLRVCKVEEERKFERSGPRD